MDRKKILIIDDEPQNIFALSAVLKSRGYLTASVSNASEGIKIIQDDATIRLVLMDMMMPDIDGYEATRIIRNNDNFTALPIIAVTAQAMTNDREKCLEAGVNDYISKPVDVDILTEMIKKYLD